MGLRGPKARPVLDRFAERVALTDSGCIEWLGTTNGVGYGQFRLHPDQGSRRVYAHRYSYEYHVGPIPDGLHLDHLCRNTICVNPEHLEPVTSAVNILRGMSEPARNATKTSCLRGHQLSGANLYINPTDGYRHCRTCTRARESARRRSGQNRKAAL